ncbi:MAG: YidC/Oxa1 family insertase periplasmic-domain containing protein, partial [Phycisphaeraceae bacterium]|nr:YidC/Oxa1 family insertase periplasmic-domain containing protein [Phycisphaeraceae bacterium]
TQIIYPFAAHAVTINGRRALLYANAEGAVAWGLTEKTENEAVYAVRLNSEDGEPLAEIRRHYILDPDSYELHCKQSIRNLTDGPLQVRWEQNGYVDLPQDRANYGGDRRGVIGAYFDLGYDPTRRFIATDGLYLYRTDIIELLKEDKEPVNFPADRMAEEDDLAWSAFINRYFAAAIHQTVGELTDTAELPPLDALFPDQRIVGVGRGDAMQTFIRLTSREQVIPAGSGADLDLTLFSGPRKSEVFEEAPYAAMKFEELIIYEMGCTWCTFQPIAHLLLAMLKVFHSVVFDWGIAIILLVIIVRLLLHPITKKSQINMMKMGKQMQALQPEMEKLKKKYKDDQQRFQQEQLKLFREKGVNPMNMLGCLPMLLQMPIWIALYAMLFFAIELRHEPAFYGVFQNLTNGAWPFLQDLSAPDNFIRFSDEPVRVGFPLLNMLDFSALNVLPILWAVVMYFNQKFLTPPATSEQAAQQQKMMRFMVILFPLFLYSAPSGLTLYICASTASGMLDSYIVRKHIKEQEEAGTLFEKKERKPGGFLDKLTKLAEEKQREMEAKKREMEKKQKRNK